MSAALLATGSAGPWVTTLFVSRSGLARDGVMTLVAAVIAAAGVYLSATAARRTPGAALVLTLLLSKRTRS